MEGFEVNIAWLVSPCIQRVPCTTTVVGDEGIDCLVVLHARADRHLVARVARHGDVERKHDVLAIGDMDGTRHEPIVIVGAVAFTDGDVCMGIEHAVGLANLPRVGEEVQLRCVCVARACNQLSIVVYPTLEGAVVEVLGVGYLHDGSIQEGSLNIIREP